MIKGQAFGNHAKMVINDKRMKGRVRGKKVSYQVFISLLEEASTHSPASQEKKFKNNFKERRQWELDQI